MDIHLRGYGHVSLPPDPLVHGRALDRLLEIFARHRTRATFFIVAREVPSELARLTAIQAAGHEVASHGLAHLSGLSRRSESEIRHEVRGSKERLEAATGRHVLGFRAADWAVAWRLVAELGAAGYQYDASLVPSPALTAGRLLLAVRARSMRDVLGVRLPPSLRRLPFRWLRGGQGVVEFPLSVSPWLRVPIYHTLRPRLADASFERHLDGFAARGEPVSYALHGVDALGLREDGVDQRLGDHPGMAASLEEKLALLDRTVAAITARFEVRPYQERLLEFDALASPPT